MIRILVADDHPIVRKGIIQVLKFISKSYLIDEVDNAQDAILKASKNEYEIIMLDISMPKGGGLGALEQIKKIKPHSKVLMLSVYDEKQYIMRSLKLGACGYLTKSNAADELETAIKKVQSGGKFLSSAVAEKIAYMLNDEDQSLHEKLTNREFQVICLIAKGMSISDIARELSLSAKTVSTYRTRLLEKMSLKNNYDIIKYAMKHNLIDDSEK